MNSKEYPEKINNRSGYTSRTQHTKRLLTTDLAATCWNGDLPR